MYKILFFSFSFTLLSCNNIVELIYEAQKDKVETINFNEYHYVIDRNNRRALVNDDNKLLDGHYIIMKNGIASEEFDVVDGYLHGEYIKYNESGHIETKENYSRSYLNGPHSVYYDTGELKYETSYTNDELTGDEIEYDRNGFISSKKSIQNGVVYNSFYIDGKIAGSQFDKTIDGKIYGIMVKYDSFDNIELIIGSKKENPEQEFSVFNYDYSLIEVVNPKLDPQKAMYYMKILKGLQ